MSRIHNQYRELESSYNYIDKTECLEKEIERFPSVYIEGAAGCGKTTMMRMFLEKHPEVDYTVLWMDEDEKDKEYEEYERYVDKYVDNSRWLILENVPEELPLHTVGMIKRSIRRLGGQDRIILIGRNEIPDALLGTCGTFRRRKDDDDPSDPWTDPSAGRRGCDRCIQWKRDRPECRDETFLRLCTSGKYDPFRYNCGEYADGQRGCHG